METNDVGLQRRNDVRLFPAEILNRLTCLTRLTIFTPARKLNEATAGRPDYNFRLGGQTKFFVEVKVTSELDCFEREIAAMKEEIDDLVYGLYEITREETIIIEEA